MLSFTSLTVGLAQGNGPSISRIIILVLGLLVAVVVLAIIAPQLLRGRAGGQGPLVSRTEAGAPTAAVQWLLSPERTVTILEGEGIVNDATGLVAYRVAVAPVGSGVLGLVQAGVHFVVLSVVRI